VTWIGFCIAFAGIIISMCLPVTTTRMTDTTFIGGTQFGTYLCDTATMTCTKFGRQK
jgi:hypothetical protein